MKKIIKYPKISEALIRGYKDGRRKTMKGFKHSEETKRGMSESHKGEKHPLYGKHHSKEAKEKMSKSMKEHCKKNKSHRLGKENKWGHHTKEAKIIIGNIHRGLKYSEETKNKMRKPKTEEHKKNISKSKKISQKKKWQDKDYREKQLNAIFKGLELKPNKPEKIMINLIKENNLPFNYVGDGQVIIGGFNPDFLSKNPKKIIELFGDYWHNREDVKKRDKERLRTYKKYGYETLVIWQNELKNTSQVLNKIRGFINV